MKEMISYRKIFEGIVKFNVIVLLVTLTLIISERFSFHEYYLVLGRQGLLIFLTLGLSHFYMKYRSKNKDDFVASKESLRVGVISGIVITYLYVIYISAVPFDIWLWLFVTLSLVIGLLYWFVVVALSNSSFLNFIIRFLDTDFTYKDFIKVVLIINAFFAVTLFCAYLVVPYSSLDRNIFSSIFVILYFEAAFFVIHFVVAKIVDLIWHRKDKVFSNASMLGLILGSMFYVIKINVIDQSLLNLFYFAPIKGSLPLVAWMTLVVFWTFFALLFHFEVKYPLRRFARKKQDV